MNTSPTHNNTVTLLSDYDTELKNLFLNSAKTLCMEPSVIDYLLMELLRRIAEQSNLHGNPRFVTTSMFIKSLAIKRKGPPTAGEEALLALYPILDKMMDKEKEKAREQWLVDHQLAPAPEEKKDKKKKDKKKKKKKKSKKNNLKTTGLTAEQMKRIEEQKAAAQRKKKASMSPRRNSYNAAPSLPSTPVGNEAAAAAVYPPSAAAKHPSGSTSRKHGPKKQGPPLESSSPKKKIKVEPGTTTKEDSTQLLFHACDEFCVAKGPSSAVSAGSKTKCGPPELVDLYATKSSSFDSDIDDEIANIDLKKSVAANTLRQLKQGRSKVVVETQRRGKSHSFNAKDRQKSDESSIDSGDSDSSSQSSTTTEDSYDSDCDFIKNSSESDTEVSGDSSDEESLSEDSSDESSSSDSSDSD